MLRNDFTSDRYIRYNELRVRSNIKLLKSKEEFL